VTPERRSLLVAPRVAAVIWLIAAVLLPTALPRAAAGEPGSTPFLTVRIDGVSPDVVTVGSEPTVTITGTVSNVGDRPVREIVARLEHAPMITSSAQLRTDLDGDTSQFEPVAEFIDVAGELERGGSAGFAFSYPLRAGAGPALGVDRPGVYPLLVNVNGTPDYGAPARLDDARFLLPVLGLPPQDPADGQPADAVAPDTTRPVQTTLLWPLADRPRLAPGAPGGSTPIRLVDDELAASLAAGGRLDTLLGAAEFATSPAVDPGQQVTRALCLAIDPDLLVTVNAMTAGYTVSDSRDQSGTAGQPGAGQAAAAAWLGRLRALATRICVVAAPYAQADLDALQRIGDPALGAFAVSSATDLVEQILGTRATRGATLVGDEPLSGRVVDLLDAQGNTVAIAAADCAAQDSDSGAATTADLTPRRVSPQVVAASFDPGVGAALAAAGDDPAPPLYLDSSLSVTLRDDSVVARRQDAVASMLWRALDPTVEPRSQILMPPLVWTLQPADAQAILTALATSIRTGLSAPRPLTDALAEASAYPNSAQPTSVAADADSTSRFDDGVIDEIDRQVVRLAGLTAALTTNQQTGLTGPQYTAPLREDMLRALSQSEPPAARNGFALRHLDVVGETVTDLIGAVTIVNPGGSYTLATERSPLPLALRNDLAVPIRVRLQVDAPPGMTVTDIGEQELPPGYLPIRVPIEVHFTQRVAVDVALHTPDGLALGEPVRLSVHSNAYGKVLFFISLTAGAVLVALTARRLWHRFRGQPDPADLDRPKRPRR
jgi:hypothetical protein